MGFFFWLGFSVFIDRGWFFFLVYTRAFGRSGRGGGGVGAARRREGCTPTDRAALRAEGVTISPIGLNLIVESRPTAIISGFVIESVNTI